MRETHKFRPYQEEALAAIEAARAGRWLTVLATGLGKTVIFSAIPRKGRHLILSHREELVTQPLKYYDCDCGVERAENKSHGEPVVSASVQTLHRRLDKFAPDDFDTIIVDEAHHATANTYRKILNHFTPRRVLGFTATPNRQDNIGLAAVFDEIIYHKDLRWGIENNYLSPVKALRVNIGYDMSRVMTKMGDYAEGDLDKFVNIEAANAAIAEAYQKHAIGQTLIFAINKAHAQAIASHIPGSVCVLGGEDRTQTVEDFKHKRVRCLVNCMVFTEGTDLPNVETVMIARPTKNVSLYTQMVGRGTRLAPGKDCLTLIDLVGAINDVNLCTAPSLIGLDISRVPEPRKKYIEGDLFELGEKIQRQLDTPEAWIRNVEYVDIWAAENSYRLHNVNYTRLPDGSLKVALDNKQCIIVPAPDALGHIYGRPAQEIYDATYRRLEAEFDAQRPLWDLKIARRWGARPASEKQMHHVKKYWPEAPDNLTMLQAGQILNRVFGRRAV